MDRDAEAARDEIPFGFDEDTQKGLSLIKIVLTAMAAEPSCHAMERPSNGELVVASAPRKGTVSLTARPHPMIAINLAFIALIAWAVWKD